jgi:phosphotransferase system HPr (HPr) family protein
MSRSSERTVRLPADLHARPAGRFSRTAAGFDASVTLGVGEREVDARSVLLVMGLGATAGADVTIRATGDDADAAVQALADVLESVAPIEHAPDPAPSPAS